MRRKTIRLIESIHSKGVFGPCSCGGEVLYYTDKGVRCSTCGKLYGVWTDKRRSLMRRAKELLIQTQAHKPGDKESEESLSFDKLDMDQKYRKRLLRDMAIDSQTRGINYETL